MILKLKKNKPLKIVLIGLGGIGSWLVEPLYKYLSYSLGIPFQFILVDGDKYEDSNLDRQKVVSGINKAISWADYFRVEHEAEDVFAIPRYLDEKTLSILNDAELILLAVDNHATRKLVDDYIGKAKNPIVVVSGGNDYTDGNIMVRYFNKVTKSLSPSLASRHSEIATPTDRNPSDIGCDELIESEPQLIVTNFMMASMMLNAIYNILTQKEQDYEEVYGDVLLNKSRPVQWFNREE